MRKDAGYQTLGNEEKKDSEKEERREKTIRGRLGSHDLADRSLTSDSPTGAFPSNLDSHCLLTRLTKRRSKVELPPLLSGPRTPGFLDHLTWPDPSGLKETSHSEDWRQLLVKICCRNALRITSVCVDEHESDVTNQ